LYETHAVLKVRFAASCRGEAVGRANRIGRSLERLVALVRAAGYEVEAKRSLPKLAERPKRRLLDAEPAEWPDRLGLVRGPVERHREGDHAVHVILASPGPIDPPAASGVSGDRGARFPVQVGVDGECAHLLCLPVASLEWQMTCRKPPKPSLRSSVEGVNPLREGV
jgi:hypothetical protein